MGYGYQRGCLLIPLQLPWLRFPGVPQREFSAVNQRAHRQGAFCRGYFGDTRMKSVFCKGERKCLVQFYYKLHISIVHRIGMNSRA